MTKYKVQITLEMGDFLGFVPFYSYRFPVLFLKLLPFRKFRCQEAFIINFFSNLLVNLQIDALMNFVLNNIN